MRGEEEWKEKKGWDGCYVGKCLVKFRSNPRPKPKTHQAGTFKLSQALQTTTWMISSRDLPRISHSHISYITPELQAEGVFVWSLR